MNGASAVAVSGTTEYHRQPPRIEFLFGSLSHLQLRRLLGDVVHARQETTDVRAGIHTYLYLFPSKLTLSLDSMFPYIVE